MKIRRGFIRMARQKVIGMEFSWLLGQGLKYLAIRKAIARGDGTTTAAPVVAHYFFTRRCNLKCPMCDIPNWDGAMESDGPTAVKIVDQMLALGVGGISFTGGEPLLRSDIFDLIARVRARRRPAILVTNGLRLADLADRVIDAGPSVVNVSIDGADAAAHDRSRGVAGAFERTLSGVNTLKKKIRRRRAGIELVASTVLSQNNAGELGRIIDLCRQTGFDRIIICPMHEFTGNGCRVAPLEADHDIQHFLLGHRHRAMIDNSDRYLGRLNAVLAGQPPPAGCRAGYTTLIVDHEGAVYPCKCYFENRIRLTGQRAPDHPLKHLWHSAPFNRFRRENHRCRGCYLTINREFDGLFS